MPDAGRAGRPRPVWPGARWRRRPSGLPGVDPAVDARMTRSSRVCALCSRHGPLTARLAPFRMGARPVKVGQKGPGRAPFGDRPGRFDDCREAEGPRPWFCRADRLGGWRFLRQHQCLPARSAGRPVGGQPLGASPPSVPDGEKPISPPRPPPAFGAEADRRKGRRCARSPSPTEKASAGKGATAQGKPFLLLPGHGGCGRRNPVRFRCSRRSEPCPQPSAVPNTRSKMVSTCFVW